MLQSINLKHNFKRLYSDHAFALVDMVNGLYYQPCSSVTELSSIKRLYSDHVYALVGTVNAPSY